MILSEDILKSNFKYDVYVSDMPRKKQLLLHLKNNKKIKWGKLKTIRNNFLNWLIRKIFSKHLQKLYSNFTTCNKCGMPWTNCNDKSIALTNNTGMFAVCDYCWRTSTLDQLIKYHMKSYLKWHPYEDEIIDKIVLNISKEFYDELHNGWRNKIWSNEQLLELEKNKDMSLHEITHNILKRENIIKEK